MERGQGGVGAIAACGRGMGASSGGKGGMRPFTVCGRDHLDVSIKSVGSKDSAGALISLSLVLLKGGHIAGIGVGQTSNGYGDIPPRGPHLQGTSPMLLMRAEKRKPYAGWRDSRGPA